MAKIAFLFPGQGAQFAGMGKRVADDFAVAKDVFAEADEALGEKISDLCWNGPEDTLRLTANAQPAILTVSVACLYALREYSIEPAFAAGLSLGEYSALVCAGVLDFRDAVRLVRKRGEIMQEATPLGVGAMAAVIGLENHVVEQACSEALAKGVVEAANYNCPGQVVISGDKAAVEEASRIAVALGAKRVIPLNVSAPFHSKLMQPAGDRFAQELGLVRMEKARVPVIANVTASAVTEPSEVRRLLELQMAKPVLWEQSVRQMIAEGVDTFIEVGPGKSLAGFVKKIATNTPCLTFDSRESLEAILESTGMGC